jgi:D-alanyl-D-alanine carboxypeptidase
MSNLRTNILSFLLTIGCACGLPDDHASSAVSELLVSDRYRPYVERVQRELANAGVPGAALAIIEARELKLVTGIGQKSADASDPVGADTMFRIGSISKTFAAATAVQLESQHKLSLDLSIKRYLPDIPLVGADDGRAITLRRLLSHTAGMPDAIELSCATGPGALDAWFRSHAPLTVEAPPGRLFNYSNLGYALAGYALERATGTPFEQLVQQTLIEPLALRSTTYDAQVALAGDHARGHVAGEDGETDDEATSAQCAVAVPPGMLWSSARDLATFTRALLRGSILSRRAQLELIVPETRMGTGPGAFYDLGLIMQPLRGEIAIWHSGGLPGFRALMVTVPVRGAGLVLLTNGDGFDPTPLGFEMIGDLLGLPAEQPVDLSTPPSDWQRYVGEYRELDAGAYPPLYVGTFVVQQQGDTLLGRLPLIDDELHVLTQLGADTWSLELDGDTYPFTFWRGAHGQAMYVAARGAILRRASQLPATTH